MAEKPYTEEFVERKLSDERIEKVAEAQDEARYLQAIKEWERLTYDEAYQKMQKIFRGLRRDYGDFQVVFEKFEPRVTQEFIQPIKEFLESKKLPVRILVTGLGVSGKSTVMGVLVQELARQFSPKKGVVLGVNRDYYDQKELPPADIILVENVNAFTGIPDPLEARIRQIESEEAKNLERGKIGELLKKELDGFDLIIYTSPTPEDYTRYWQERVKAWRERELISQEGPRSEAEAKRAVENREKWLAEDEEKLRKLEKEGKKVIRVDPDPVLREFFRIIK